MLSSHGIWSSILVCATLATANAAPAPTVITMDVELSSADRLSFRSVPQAPDEPGGLVIGSDPRWEKLGLKPGDIVRAAGGEPVGERLRLGEGTLLLDIDRGGKQVLLRLILRGDPRRDVKLTDSDFERVLNRVRPPNYSALSTPIRSKAGPSGVRIIDELLFIHLELKVGDIIRTINGKPIQSDAQLVAALETLGVGTNDVQLDRDGRRIMIAIEREAPLDLTRIKRRSETAYEVPHDVRDVLKNDFMILTRKVQFSPALTKGKAHGMTLYDIEPGSLYEALGFRNNDTVVDVDGHSIDSSEEAISTHTALEKASQITVNIMRRGKPLAIVYTIR